MDLPKKNDRGKRFQCDELPTERGIGVYMQVAVNVRSKVMSHHLTHEPHIVRTIYRTFTTRPLPTESYLLIYNFTVSRPLFFSVNATTWIANLTLNFDLRKACGRLATMNTVKTRPVHELWSIYKDLLLALTKSN